MSCNDTSLLPSSCGSTQIATTSPCNLFDISMSVSIFMVMIILHPTTSSTVHASPSPPCHFIQAPYPLSFITYCANAHFTFIVKGLPPIVSSAANSKALLHLLHNDVVVQV